MLGIVFLEQMEAVGVAPNFSQCNRSNFESELEVQESDVVGVVAVDGSLQMVCNMTLQWVYAGNYKRTMSPRPILVVVMAVAAFDFGEEAPYSIGFDTDDDDVRC